MRRLSAKEIMTTPVTAVRTSDPIPDVVRTLRRHGISGAPVLDEFGLGVGVVSEADIVVKEAGPGGYSDLAYAGRRDPRHHASRRAGEIMTQPVVMAQEETPVHEVAALMVRHNVNRVPIMRGENLVGMVSRADVVALFDRAPGALLADTRRVLTDDLLIDPNALEIVVINGVVAIGGEVNDGADIGLIETYVGQIDGVSSVDVSKLRAADTLSA